MSEPTGVVYGDEVTPDWEVVFAISSTLPHDDDCFVCDEGCCCACSAEGLALQAADVLRDKDLLRAARHE